LSDSTLFIYDLKKNSTERISPKGDKIADFIISLDFKYIAYAKIIRYVEYRGDADDSTSESNVAEVPLVSIKVMALDKKNIIQEISPIDNEFINLDKWISSNELLYGMGDFLSFGGWIKYTLHDSVRRYSDMDKYSDLGKIISVTKNAEYVTFIDESSVLHRYNFLSKSNLELPGTNNTMIDCEQSYNKKFITWLEVVDKTSTNKKTGSFEYHGSTDKVILFSLTDWKKREIYTNDAADKGLRKYLSFSPNDSVITIELDKKINLKNIFTAEYSFIYGHNLNWIDSTNFIYENLGCIFLYNIKEKKSKLLISDSSLAYTIL
jgi:hypothetical protein